MRLYTLTLKGASRDSWSKFDAPLDALILLGCFSACPWAISQHAPVRGDCVFKQDAALFYDRARLFDVMSFVCFLKAFGAFRAVA